MMKEKPESDPDAVFIDGLTEAAARFEFLAEQNKKNAGEMSKLRQYMTATTPLLSDDNREGWEAIIEVILEQAESTTASTLTIAIKRVLQTHFPDYLSAARVRDELIVGGFDFSSYKSNELASVSTTLRRIQSEIEFHEKDGTTEYRLQPPGLPKSAVQVKRALDSAKRMRFYGPPEKIPE